MRAALRAYHELHGDVRVPFGFVVPSALPWPRACWGLKLGHRVSDIRAKQDSDGSLAPGAVRREELDALGGDRRERLQRATRLIMQRIAALTGQAAREDVLNAAASTGEAH